MKVIPAIDIRGGKVVRLTQGEAGRETIYSGSPIDVARNIASLGVELIHVVDLDGAFQGAPKNLDIIGQIAKAVSAKIELGGGVRDIKTINQVLNSGVSKVVVGTLALDEKLLADVVKRFKNSIVVGIDAREGMVCTKGWTNKTDIKAIDLAKKVEAAGIKTINYTDISKDGMLEGPNIDSLKELLSAVKIEVVAAGGVTTVEDVRRLKELEKDGLAGIIMGKALYEKKIDLQEAIEICK